MRTHWIVAAALACSAVASAQDRASSTQATTGNASNDGAMVTMTGCVTRDDLSYANGRKSVGGRAVTTGGTADKFLLSSARVSASSTNGAVGTSGTGTLTSNTDPRAFEGPRYLLVGQSADFRAQLGHQVEVTGRVTNAAMTEGSGPAVTENKNELPRTTASGVDAKEQNDADAAAVYRPQIQVNSIKMIATTCEVK
jgi:hypothetical protein